MQNICYQKRIQVIVREKYQKALHRSRINLKLWKEWVREKGKHTIEKRRKMLRTQIQIGKSQVN